MHLGYRGDHSCQSHLYVQSVPRHCSSPVSSSSPLKYGSWVHEKLADPVLPKRLHLQYWSYISCCVSVIERSCALKKAAVIGVFNMLLVWNAPVNFGRAAIVEQMNTWGVSATSFAGHSESPMLGLVGEVHVQLQGSLQT